MRKILIEGNKTIDTMIWVTAQTSLGTTALLHGSVVKILKQKQPARKCFKENTTLSYALKPLLKHQIQHMHMTMNKQCLWVF